MINLDMIHPDFVSRKRNTNRSRFWKFVNVLSDGECWEWLGHRTIKGYGTFKLPPNITIHSHRYSYYIDTGHFPKSMEYICHCCDNPACVNPKHLFLGNQADNVHDMMKKGRGANHSGENNPSSKLSRLDILEIRRLHNLGVSSTNLRKMFKISPSQMTRILTNHSWIGV